jgi:DNA mismatch endonuclease (patch repair protein)
MTSRRKSSVSYDGLRPASPRASQAARGASKKADTRCEVLLRRALWKEGCRFRKNRADLPGKPDIVFSRMRLVIFCDGDFWHGRDWEQRREKLRRGNNPSYWVNKIRRNRERDHENQRRLEEAGWSVLRFWETDILAHPGRVTQEILLILDKRGHRKSRESPASLTAAPQERKKGVR